MALEYCDGFTDYSASQITRYYNSEVPGNGSGSTLTSVVLDGNPTISAGTGRNGNSSLRFSGDGKGLVWTASSQATRAIGFAWKGDRFVNNIVTTLAFAGFTDANVIQLALRTNSTGTISVVRGLGISGGGTVLATSTNTLTTGSYYYIEFTATIHNTTGAYTLNVNGIQWLTATGVNTRQTSNNSCNGVVLGPLIGSNIGLTWDYSDLYINNSGTFYGDCRVEVKMPNGNGATNNFTRGGTDSGANWSQVNEATANDDTNYVLSGSAGDIDLYTYPALGAAGAVIGVMPVPVLENDTAGSSSIQVVYRSGGINYVGATGNPSSGNYFAFPDIKETDPSTSLAWTTGGVNSAQFGIKRVS